VLRRRLVVRLDVLQHLLESELANPMAADRALAVVRVALLERGVDFQWWWFIPSSRHSLAAALQGGCNAAACGVVQQERLLACPRIAAGSAGTHGLGQLQRIGVVLKKSSGACGPAPST
jgi:hypothetical protein